MTTPDVTVVVAVYNTMPYLTECLDSLVGQSIGHERLQVVAVDDGSTDDSGKELDRYAQRYPDVFTVVHQPNSGGPAAPSNRALDLATGRFVYFIGSDDHLGEEALERMVACADANESDVVVGKMVGTNGRYVHQKLYTGNRDVTLDDSELPFTLANTKLFRRELVEKHGLRFPEDMPVGSDQPFTIEACVRARKISVISDYTCYYAVKRGDASNITYRANHLARLRCVQRIMEHTATLIPAGPRRDAVFKRHFDWELTKLLQKDFPALDADTRRQVCEGVGALVRAHFTDGLRDGTGVKRRVRFGLARSGAVDELTRAIAEETEHGAPPFLLEGDRAFASYPGSVTRPSASTSGTTRSSASRWPAGSPPAPGWSRSTGSRRARTSPVSCGCARASPATPPRPSSPSPRAPCRRARTSLGRAGCPPTPRARSAPAGSPPRRRGTAAPC